MKKGKLFLIPTFLGDANDHVPLAAYQLEQISHVKFFITENAKTARAAIKKFGMKNPLQEMHFSEMEKHETQKPSMVMTPLLEGHDMGLMSEAGLPCVADPGNEFVAYAHKQQIDVIPLIGASSIMLGLMASGFNGQSFTFHGYIPVKEPERSKKIKQMDEDVYRKNATQIFIETPYRNEPLIELLQKTLAPETRVCIACNLLQPDQKIMVRKSRDLALADATGLHKKPCIYLLYK